MDSSEQRASGSREEARSMLCRHAMPSCTREACNEPRAWGPAGESRVCGPLHALLEGEPILHTRGHVEQCPLLKVHHKQPALKVA